MRVFLDGLSSIMIALVVCAVFLPRFARELASVLGAHAAAMVAARTAYRCGWLSVRPGRRESRPALITGQKAS